MTSEALKAYSAAVIGWQRGAATNVPRCRPITAAQ